MQTTVSMPTANLRLQQGPAARASWQLRVFRWIVRTLFVLLFRVRVIGQAHIPPTPVIVCMNHLGWSEGFLVLLFLPVEPRVYGLGERDVVTRARWRTRIVNWLEIYVPLDRDKPREAVRTMQDILRRGGSLVIAPEGRLGNQEGKLAPLQHGASYLSQTSGVPLLPVGATGTLELWLWKRLTLRIGPPILPSEFEGDLRNRTHRMTERLEQEMRALLPGDAQRPRVKLLRHWLTKLF